MSRKLVGVGLVAVIAGAVMLVVAVSQDTTSSAGEQTQQQRTVASAPAASVSPPSSAKSSSIVVSSTSVSSSSAQSAVSAVPQGSPSPTSSVVVSAPDPLQPVPAPAVADSFSVVLKTQQVGDLPAVVNGMDVASHAEVKPPEVDGCPWTDSSEVKFSDNIPTGCDWRDTSIWVRASAYPASPSTGTSYIVGHSCHLHLCPFSDIQRKPDGSYTVLVGDLMVVTTPSGVLTYQVCGVGSSPKFLDDGVTHNPTAVIPDCGGVSPDVVLATCEYEEGDLSNYNVIVAMKLVGSSLVA